MYKGVVSYSSFCRPSAAHLVAVSQARANKGRDRESRIVAVGPAWRGETNKDFGLARYNADGSLDASFATGGIATANISPVKGNDAAYFLTLQPDGRLIAAGAAYNGTDNDFALARFDARLPDTAP